MAELVKFSTLKIGDYFHPKDMWHPNENRVRDDLIFRVKQDGGFDSKGKRISIGNAFNISHACAAFAKPEEMVEPISIDELPQWVKDSERI
jgi:hypothetical protein